MTSATQRAAKRHSQSAAGSRTEGAARGWLAAMVVCAVVAVVVSLSA